MRIYDYFEEATFQKIERFDLDPDRFVNYLLYFYLLFALLGGLMGFLGAGIWGAIFGAIAGGFIGFGVLWLIGMILVFHVPLLIGLGLIAIIGIYYHYRGVESIPHEAEISKPVITKSIPDEAKTSKPVITKLPIITDYGTDMKSLYSYIEAIESTSIETCEAAFKLKISDGAYCLATKAKNKDEAVIMYKEASSLGHPISMYDLANYYTQLKKPELSVDIKRLTTAAAERGLPHAQVSVGWYSMTGEHGFLINYSDAMQWNLKADKQGHSEGAINIGELYENGNGVPKDLEQARVWYTRAGVLGNNKSTERLERLKNKLTVK
jgi:hypothetical protein